MKTKRLYIAMAYTYVGDTGIDVPMELLEGKTKEEQLEIAYKYAQEHIDEIPVANNAEYIPYSDNFEMDDISLEDQNADRCDILCQKWRNNMSNEAKKYLDAMDDAIADKLINPDSIYYGRDGHERLARECGYTLNDFDEADRKEIVSASYGKLYVKHCNLKPILDAKEWIQIMNSQVKQA